MIDPLTGDVLGVGCTGEILLQGPQVMMGYLDNQEATDKTIKDGWLYTGISQMSGQLLFADVYKSLSIHLSDFPSLHQPIYHLNTTQLKNESILILHSFSIHLEDVHEGG